MNSQGKYDASISIGSLTYQEELKDRSLLSRFDSILKESMELADLPMWVVISREYNEDPIVKSITPSAFDSSGRLSIFVFVYSNRQVEKYYIGAPHPALSKLYMFPLDHKKESQWECLFRLIEEINPMKIGINESNYLAVADGLSHRFYEKLQEQLGEKWGRRLVSAEHLIIHWFLKRSEDEINRYPFIADLTSQLAQTALSNEVITPGITTTSDVVNWIRQRVLDWGLHTSFYPTVDIQRKNSKTSRLSDCIILPGDIVHLDVGIEYAGLSTDTQQLGYVLDKEETEVPKGLLDAFNRALEFQDIVISNMIPGRSGNDVFFASIDASQKRSIEAMLYSHPIGPHCHEAGPIIGLFDQQSFVPFRGEIKLILNSAYALEFNIKEYIPEWNEETYIYLEQPIMLLEEGVVYLTPRQDSFYLIK